MQLCACSDECWRQFICEKNLMEIFMGSCILKQPRGENWMGDVNFHRLVTFENIIQLELS